ncbi:MAG: NAD(P)H-hydrate dehydratase [Chthoniobacteraceae bacterium]
MILTCAAMKELEQRAFSDGISADALMEEAGLQITRAVRQFFPRPGVCIAVFGKGNNGGDALVAARHLAASGWDVRTVAAFPVAEWGPLPKVKFAGAAGCRREEIAALDSIQGEPLVILDGLLGIGASGALREPLNRITRTINRRRAGGNAVVFALDIPTGLNSDTGEADAACIAADHTLTIGFAKQGLVADSAVNFVGRLSVLPLNELSKRLDAAPTDAVVATPRTLGALLPRRAFDTHKGDCGRVGIIAGSPGYLGAAVLCSSGCVHAGAGLVTLYAPPQIAETLAIKVPPEVMVRALPTTDELLALRHDVVAIGPGIGAQPAADVATLVRKIPGPVVLDADGLNAMAQNLTVLGEAVGERVLTPHPGEMERLAPGSTAQSRRAVMEAFTRRFPCTLLLKGARTIVGKSGERVSFNTTGTPGMAVGGMGDVLTGVIAALIGQRVRPFDAARLGGWLCGRASEIAISHGGESEESLTPSRMLDFFGAAFRDLRAGCF